MSSKMRVTWNNLAKSMSLNSTSYYATNETAFKVPVAADFTTVGTNLKKSFDDLNDALTAGKATTTVPASVLVGGNLKNGDVWDPTAADAATAKATSYQKNGCPYGASPICEDCDGTPAHGPVSPFKKG